MTLVAIPAYRAEATVGAVVEGVRRAAPGLRVLVVDDGSDDATAEAACRSGAEVVCHSRNRGKGAALRTAYARALALGAAGVLTLDADGQHPPSFIPGFLEAARGADLVLGCRMRQAHRMPWARRQTNRAVSRIVSALAGVPLRDSQCGYRWVSAAVLASVKLATSHYETETELLVRAARAGFRIAHVPMPAVYPAAEGQSHIRAMRDTARFVRLVGRLV